MARAASGRTTAIQSKAVDAPRIAPANVRRALTAALAAVIGSTFAIPDAHAQSRGLLGSPDTLSAPLLSQQTDPSTPPADPATQPADPNAPAASGAPEAGNPSPGAGGPTLSIGGTSGVAPGQASNAVKDEPAAEKKKQGMTFFDRIAGTSIFMQTGATIGTIFKGYQPDYNPQVQTYAVFSPRFAINKDWQLRGRIGGDIEYTNSDSTTSRGEFEFIDSSVLMYYRGIPALGGKVKVFPYAGAILPTSKASRSRTMIFTPNFGLQAALPIEHFLRGDLMLIAIASYGRPIYKQTTPTGLDDRPYQFNCAGGAGSACGGQLSGSTNARDSFTTAMIAAATWGKLSPGAYMLLNNQIAYAPKAVQSVGGTLPNGQEASRWRASTYFATWLDIEVNDWLTPEIGYQQQRSLRNGDGTFGNPFFSKYQEQVVYLGANIQIDSLLKKIVGEEGKAGIVRAKATPTPIRFY